MWLLEGDRARHEATWRRLDAAYAGEGPCGVLTVLDTPDPEAEWPDPRTLYVGYADDGRQARIAYFSGAVTRVLDGWPPPPDPPYRIQEFAGAGVSPDDVIALWRREGVLGEAEARRRVDEVLLVAVDRAGALIGVSTRYLRHNEQLRMDLWYVRVFVAAAHRQSATATALSVGAREHLQDAYESGRDTRGTGMAMEIENAFLRSAFFAPVWRQVKIVLIGENPRGDHVRVFFFPGATAPLP